MNKKQLILIKFILFKILIIVCLIIFYFISFFSCSGLSQEKLIKEKRFLFDSFFEIIIISRDIEKAKYDLNQLFLSLENTGIQFDWRNENSYLSKISRFENIEIEEKYINFFKDIYYYHRFTKGYFNPFLRKLILAYNNFKDGTIPPDDQKIKELLKFIKKSEIYLDKNDKVFLKYPENLDLGAAIAGFLVDFSYDYLKNMGYNNFLINGSGEIRVSGNKYGKNWIIGIQSPYSNAIIDIVSLPDSFSISTSGSYERFFIYDNLKYHHILNPFTGKPDSRLDSVSIVTKDNCLAADILSTAIFAMGIENSIKFCLENNIEYYIVYKINGETFKRFSSFFNNAINK